MSDGNITLPLYSAAGVVNNPYSGRLYVGAVTLPKHTLAGVMESPVMLVGAMSLPAYSLSGSMEPANKLPAYTLSGTLASGEILAGDVTLPFPSINGVLLSGSIFDGAVTLPQWSLDADQGLQAEITLPKHTLSGAMLAGNLSTASAQLPSFDSAGVLFENGRMDGSISLPLHTLNGVITSRNLTSGDIDLLPFSANGVMVSGNVSTGSITVPLYRVDGNGYTNSIGMARITLPLFNLSGVMASSVAAPVFSGITLNTHTQAVSTYSNGAFNSLCTFNGVVLAATSTGIVALTGNTDQGVAINASLSSGVSDFKSEQFKRVLCGYVGYRAAGNMELTLITDEHHENIYAIEPRQLGSDIHPTRVKFGKGVTGRYTQWQWANKAGADFQLDSLSLDVQELSRKIG